MTDSESSILASARKFFSGTLLSRILGMVRDLTMAFCFGSAPQVALFMVAYRWANLFRRLFGEGNLQGGFVPQFEQARGVSEEKAIQLYRDVRLSLILIVGGIIGVCILICMVFLSDLLLMMMLMLPGVLFLILYALNSSVLQCQKSYFLPAFAPALFNIIWIIAAFSLRTWDVRSALFGLSATILFAFAAQWWVTARPLTKWSRGLRANPFSQDVRRLWKPFSFGVVGIGASQINSALDALFASWADPSGPAYLWYAIRIQQLPLALFGIALTNALLPPLSRAIREGSLTRYQTLLRGALKNSLFLMIFCTIGMVVLAEVGVGLLYGHGAFLPADVTKTAVCLRAYAWGLAPMVCTLLLVNGCYAQKEYRWPMRCSLAAIALNLVLNTLFVFVFSLGVASIALATSLSSACNCALLLCRNPLSWYVKGTRTQEEY